METPEQDQRHHDETASAGPDEGRDGGSGPQQGEAPPPEEDVARNPEDPGLDALRGG